jgi:hypothetical protein
MTMRSRERADLLDAALSYLAQLPNDQPYTKALKIAGFWGRLILDVARHWASSETSASERRAFVRAAFAALDAFLSHGSSLILFLNEKGIYKLKPAEVALLQEKRLDVDSNGDVVVRNSFVPFSNKLRFLLNLGGRLSIPDYHVDVGDAGWQSLRTAITKRDQLTHPKELAHLEVQEEDLRQFKQGLEWLSTQLLLTLLLNCFAPVCRKMNEKYPLESATSDDLKKYLVELGPTKSQDEACDLRELQDVQALGGFASKAFILMTSRDVSRELLKILRGKNPEEKVRQVGSFLRTAI